jgi:hypothetical protein
MKRDVSAPRLCCFRNFDGGLARCQALSGVKDSRYSLTQSSACPIHGAPGRHAENRQSSGTRRGLDSDTVIENQVLESE